MITTPFLAATTAPPPYPKFQRQIVPGFRTRSGVPFGVKCLHSSPWRPIRVRATEERREARPFASTSSSSNQETSSVVVNPQLSLPPPSPSSVGSPLFWIGVGVGLSVLFSFVATNLKKYAMQQAFKTMMGQMNSQNNQFNNAAFSSGSPFPFPMPPTPAPPASPPPASSGPGVTVDVPATNVEEAAVTVVKDETEVKMEPKKLAFVDVSPEEAEQKSPYESIQDVPGTCSPNDTKTAGVVSENGAASKPVDASQWFRSTYSPPGSEGSSSTRKPVISVEALEKMMEDPTVQKIVYPHLPEELRNPATFKWMLQNPVYRQQLEEMMNNMMSSNGEWDDRVMDSFKDFDLNSPEFKQQFDQIGLSPEETFARIMENPELRVAFQNPRIQAAIMDCSQDPHNISKFQNDKEVMDLFNKISELFPGVPGPPRFS